jgi:predicted aspartyl protease
MRERSVSATPKVQLWTGYFDKSGSPALKVTIKGPFGEPVEFDAILDTGFSGFVCMPLLRALPLGLLLYGTTSVELADGSKSTKLTARGMVGVEGESKVGVVILEPSSDEVLLGMAFLRLFKRGLFVTQNVVLLVDEARKPDKEAPPKAASTEPPKAPKPPELKAPPEPPLG